MKIDSHHHFWNYSPVEYDWIDDAMSVIRRDFLPGDLQRAMVGAGVDGAVSVQARQSLAETEWLLGLSAQHDFICGVVGWVDLKSPKVGDDLARFATHPKMKAVRHVVQAEPDQLFLSREDFNRGIRELKKFSLVYDLLIVERQLPAAVGFVDRHPEQAFVLDHIAKPRIREGMLGPWSKNIRELAKRPNVCCKLSGLVSEADYTSWTDVQLRPYFETVLEAFGPRRLMFGSDWPVCLVACDYSRWVRTVATWVSKLTLEEQDRIWGGTAREVYKL